MRDLGQHVRDVGGRDRLYEQRRDRRAAVLLGPRRNHLGEVMKLRRGQDAPRHRALFDELLLGALARTVRVARVPREADNRQQYVMLNPGLSLCVKQVAGRLAEEPDCLLVVGRVRAGRVDHSVDAGERADEPFTGVHVDALCPADPDGFVARPLQRRDGEAADASRCADYCDSHALRSSHSLSDASRSSKYAIVSR